MIEKKAVIHGQQYEGERPLFAKRALRIEHSTFNPGESPLKYGIDVDAVHCDFRAKYPFWHGDRITIADSTFHPQSRAAIWYSHHVRMSNCMIDAPKMFRRVEHLEIEHCDFSDAAETGWACRDIRFSDVTVSNGDYFFMNSDGIRGERFHLEGNYAFDGARNIEIRNAVLASKDAFWNAENVTVYDSILDGEYLGWHSKNLKLVNCTIKGTQPLCFATDLVLENCRLDEGCDLCFEYSSVQASIHGRITSVKNPISGAICADEIGEIILDENMKPPANCRIHTRMAKDKRMACCALDL